MWPIVGLVLVASAAAAPATSPAPGVIPLEKQVVTVVPIIAQTEELESNGTYKFSYETGDGIKREEISYDKVLPKAEGRSADSGEVNDTSNEIHVQQGSYSYTAPDGTVISVKYIADENGFQPIGDHIPKPVSLSISAGNSEKSARALTSGSSATEKFTKKPEAKEAEGTTTEKPLSTSEAAKTNNASTSEKPTDAATEATNATTEKAAEATTEAAKTEPTEATSTEKSTAAPEVTTTEVTSTTAL